MTTSLEATAPEMLAVSRGRRLLDIALAGAALVVLSPVLGAVAVVVRLTSPGPVLFRQVRLTSHRREFTMYKFRSMWSDSTGPELTLEGDPRVTGIGRFLRRTSADELPQLLNVLRGEMTLVGPRPETPALGMAYPREVQWILDCTPGLTGPAQIRLRARSTLPASMPNPQNWYLEHLVPERVACDRTFLADPSVRATLRVLADTVGYLITGRSPHT